MDARLLYPSQYLSAPDLRGKDVTLTISGLTHEQLRTENGPELGKWVLTFSEMEKRAEKDRKRFVLNKTNAKLIAATLGNDTDKWLGGRITLYATTCRLGGKKVDCIRIKAAPAKQEQPAA